MEWFQEWIRICLILQFVVKIISTKYVWCGHVLSASAVCPYFRRRHVGTSNRRPLRPPAPSLPDLSPLPGLPRPRRRVPNGLGPRQPPPSSPARQIPRSAWGRLRLTAKVKARARQRKKKLQLRSHFLRISTSPPSCSPSGTTPPPVAFSGRPRAAHRRASPQPPALRNRASFSFTTRRRSSPPLFPIACRHCAWRPSPARYVPCLLSFPLTLAFLDVEDGADFCIAFFPGYFCSSCSRTWAPASPGSSSPFYVCIASCMICIIKQVQFLIFYLLFLISYCVSFFSFLIIFYNTAAYLGSAEMVLGFANLGVIWLFYCHEILQDKVLKLVCTYISCTIGISSLKEKVLQMNHFFYILDTLKQNSSIPVCTTCIAKLDNFPISQIPAAIDCVQCNQCACSQQILKDCSLAQSHLRMHFFSYSLFKGAVIH